MPTKSKREKIENLLQSKISEALKKQRKEMVEKIKRGLGKTFRSSPDGLHGYQVLPNCGEEKHDIEECADCFLSTLTKEEWGKKQDRFMTIDFAIPPNKGEK